MADVMYLKAGDDVGASHWNDLFSEADRKVGAAMDNHSLIYGSTQAKGITEGLLGTTFYFLGNFVPYTARNWLPIPANYNHAPFTAGAASAVLEPGFSPNYDVTRKVLRVVSSAADGFTPNLDNSMEAHQRLFQPPQVAGQVRPPQELYWLWERNSRQPQKIYTFAMAELVVEGYGPLLTIEHNWNKYNFFRINNVQETPLVVRFNSGPGVVGFEYTVPKYESICIRRTAVGGVYTVGYRYFHKFLPGDPRHLGLGVTQSTTPALLSMRANNVCYPFLLRDWVARFVPDGELDVRYPQTETQAGGGGPRLFMDAKVTQDCGDLWKDRFPPVGNAELPIGDFLYHKGKMALTNELATPDIFEIDFQGFGTLPAALAAAGITVGRDASGQVTMGKAGPRKWDLIPLSTNLLNRGGRAFGANISDAVYAIYGLAPNLIAPYDAPHGGGGIVGTERVVTWLDATGGVHSVSLMDVLPSKQVSVATSWQIDKDTLTKVLQFNLIGNAAYAARNQDTDYAAFTNRKAVMTPWGLMLLADLEVSLGYMTSLIQYASDSHYNTVIAGYWALMARGQIGGPDLWRLVVPVRLWFRDYMADPGLTGRFHTPRIGRVAEKYVSLAAPSLPLLSTIGTRVHGSAVDEIYGPNGADVTVPELKATEVFPGGKEIQIWSSMASLTGENGTTIGVTPTDEGLYSAWKNFGDGLLWQANRSFVVGGTVPVESRGVYWRMVLSVENYNCLAWLVNAIKYAYPLNWQDNGLVPFDSTLRTGGVLPAFPFGFNGIGPKEAYNSGFTFDYAGALARYAYIGIPLYGFNDLPDLGHLATITSKARKVVGINVTSSGVVPNRVTTLNNFSIDPTRTWTLPELIFGGPDSVFPNTPKFIWTKIADVKAYAEARGFKFIFEDFVNGMEVIESGATVDAASGTVRQPDIPWGGSAQAASFAMLVSAEREEDVRWTTAGDVVWKGLGNDGLQQAGLLVNPREYVLLADEAIEVEDLLVNWGATNQPRSTWVFSHLRGINPRILEKINFDTHPPTSQQPLYAATRKFDASRFEGRRLLFRNFNSVGLPRESKVMLIPMSWAVCKARGFTTDGTSCAAVVLKGAEGYPLEAHSVPATGAEGTAVPVCHDREEQFVEAPGGGPSGLAPVAWRVVHFRDCLIRL